MERLKAFFNTVLPLTDEEWDAFASGLEGLEVKKKDILLKEDQVCDYIAFIQKGAFRFYVNKDGNELITAFFFAGDFVTNYRSYLTGAPSEHDVQALQDAVI